jgi:hypothetical protein
MPLDECAMCGKAWDRPRYREDANFCGMECRSKHMATINRYRSEDGCSGYEPRGDTPNPEPVVKQKPFNRFSEIDLVRTGD